MIYSTVSHDHVTPFLSLLTDEMESIILWMWFPLPVLEMKIWIYWSESNSRIYFILKNLLVQQSFTGLGLEDQCSWWGLQRIGSMLYCIVSIKRIINVFYCHSATIAFNITTNSILIIKYLRKRVIDCLLKCCLCTVTENTDARNWSILF
jgi:hypothetical protein